MSKRRRATRDETGQVGIAPTARRKPPAWAIAVLAVTVVAAAIAVLRSPARKGAVASRDEESQSAPADPAAPGLTMAERLERVALADAASPELNPYASRALADGLLKATPPVQPAQRVRFEMQLAFHLLYDGRTREALDRLTSIRPLVSAGPDRSLGAEVDKLVAIAWLRLGEQENCLTGHAPESCIMPIEGAGIHRLRAGSEAAIREYVRILSANPMDLGARWLINVAAMTLGEYPANVPEAFLVPPSAFTSEREAERMRDIGPLLGVAEIGLAGGCAMDDFDGDGDLDIVATSYGMRDPMRYFRNEGDGRFHEAGAEAGLKGMLGGMNLNHADYDNDGDLDLFVMRGGWLHEAGRIPDSLLQNDGSGRFMDVTEEAGLLSFKPGQAAAWADYDNDGWLDLFVSSETDTAGGTYPCELYHSNRDGTFSEVAAQAGLDVVGFAKAVGWGDYDNDGRPDLYVSLHAGWNRLYHNDGPDASGRWRFTDVAEQAGVLGAEYSFPTFFFDFDNDGWEDIFVADYEHRPEGAATHVAADYLGLPMQIAGPRLYRNRGDGTFADETEQRGLDRVLYAMGCNFGDLDGDGFLDIYVGTGTPDFRDIFPNRMFLNDRGRRFRDATTAAGLGHLQKGHGIAFGDLDGDGDQDIYAVMGGFFTGDVYQNALFENPGSGNHWITLVLQGVRSNRSGFGARVRVRVTGPDGPVDLRVTAGTGGSYGSSSLQQEVGVGKATRIAELEIRWPASGEIQIFKDVAVDQVLLVREGDAAPVVLDRTPIKLVGDPAAAAVHVHTGK